MVAFNLWIYYIVFASVMGLLTANNVSYAMGPRGASLQDAGLPSLAVSAGLI